jgi:hypothetical protein
MSVEYLVLQADAEQGPFARVHAHKLNQSWETLQEALDELGQHDWPCTPPFTAPPKNAAVLESIIAKGLFSNVCHIPPGNAFACPSPCNRQEPSSV